MDLPPELWQEIKNCMNKDRHKTMYDALNVVRNMERRGQKVRFYECPHCKGWHTSKK